MDISASVGIDSYLVTAGGELCELDPQRSYLFGRDPKVEFSVNDALCSREHCRLRWDASGDWMVEDLGSRNGTLVDGVKITTPVVLTDRSAIQIGGQRFVLCLLPPGADAGDLVADVLQVGGGETFEMDAAGGGPRASEPLRGRLKNLEEILRFFMLTSKTGRFQVDGGHQIWFVEGVPRHAESGTEQGLAALRSLVSLEGAFEFYEDETQPGAPTIEGKIQAILAELFGAVEQGDRRIEAYDLNRATELQRHLMERLPTVPGYDIGVFFKGLSGVSGDFYDVSVLADGRVMIVLGDVSGHGIQAAMVGTNILKTLRLLRQRYQDLGDLLRVLNQEMRNDMLPGQFATLFAAILHPPSGRMEIALTGHHPALVVDREGIAAPREAGGRGLAMGIGSDAQFRSALKLQTIRLAVGEALLQFTDGMFESMDADGQEYGWERLMDTVSSMRDCPDMKTLTSSLTSEIDAFAHSLEDDLTVLAIARVAEVGTRAVLAQQPQVAGPVVEQDDVRRRRQVEADAEETATAGSYEPPGDRREPAVAISQAVAASSPAVDFTDRELGGATILKPLENGRLYLGRHQVLGADVAVEIVADPKDPAAYDRAVRPYLGIKHPNVVKVHEVGTAGDCCYQVMELVAGGTLEQRLEVMGQLEIRELRGLVAPLAAGLAAIHAAGIIHGRLDLSCVHIDGTGQPKIAALGHGSGPGLLAYRAPETLGGSAPGAAADIYSLGAMLYHLACGQALLDSVDPTEAQRRHISGGLLPLGSRLPELDSNFIKLVDSCLHPDPARRPTSAELAQFRRPAVVTTPSQRHRRSATPPPPTGERQLIDANMLWIIGGGVVSVVLVALIIWMLAG